MGICLLHVTTSICHQVGDAPDGTAVGTVATVYQHVPDMRALIQPGSNIGKGLVQLGSVLAPFLVNCGDDAWKPLLNQSILNIVQQVL